MQRSKSARHALVTRKIFSSMWDVAFERYRTPTQANMRSAVKNPTVVPGELGRVIGPTRSASFSTYPDKQIRGDPETSSAGEMAIHCGLVLPRRRQNQ